MNTFDHFEYCSYLLTYLFIYCFLLFCVVDSYGNSSRLPFKIANTHLCSNDLSKKWTPVPLMCVCLQIDWIIHHLSTKGTCTGRVSPHPCSAMFTPANHCARYNSHWSQSGRVYKPGTVAVDGPTERYARGPCNRLTVKWMQNTSENTLCLQWTSGMPDQLRMHKAWNYCNYYSLFVEQWIHFGYAL